MDSAEYYNQNADEYFKKTVDLDLQVYLDYFLEFIPEDSDILDLGCGSGRDSAYFLSLGYNVTALDSSKEMCNLASVHSGENVLHMTFAEMDFEDVFDGIWANASLLHVPYEEMPEILSKIVRSLKKGGLLYMTLRYGEFEGIKDERYYTDYRTRKIKDLISSCEGLDLIEVKKYEDVRPDKDVLWLHVLARKTEDEAIEDAL